MAEQHDSTQQRHGDLISVVVPCYNEEESLPLFLDELARVAEGMKTVTPPLHLKSSW